MQFRCAILASILPLFSIASAAHGEKPLDYDRDVRPILAQHCFKCHDQEKQKGSLRLDFKPSMLRGGESGEPAVVPGNVAKSHLIKVVTTSDPEQLMPPKGTPLNTEQIAVLQKWIETGAHWVAPEQAAPAAAAAEPGMQVTEQDRQFWSFRPPQKSEPPAAKNQTWAKTKIDRFVLARLEAAGLSPSPEAPREVLIRRLTYDLTGLPPTPEDVEAFLSDEKPGAYERLVDRLLASPRFGERTASLWLPLARYAEDQAHQVGSDTKAFYPNAYLYRKWVIDAFNRDLPYDRFVKLQIAADKVTDAAPEDLAALGFLGLGPKYYNRGRLEVMAEEWEDRVDTVTRTTIGLTVACARCHDHKFDPIPTTDYYALAGVFASTKMVNKSAAGVIQKGDLPAEKVEADTLHVVEDGTPQDLNLFIRGNVDRKGPAVPRHFLTVLSSEEPQPWKEGSGRRDLAAAIGNSKNPLTARVMVNRAWGMLFGNPLVATPSNFGRTGSAPTNPELLDDVSARFMENGWSVKSVIREMVLSSAYRQCTASSAANAAKDPANQLLWRMNRRRMTVEQWRDTLLDVGGNLEAGGGKSLELDDPKNNRRTVYARISRLKLNDVLMQFDYPDANVHAERRAITNTPMQKLFVMNSPFILERAKALVRRLEADAASDDSARVTRAYKLLFAREPSRQELELALNYLSKPDEGKISRWERYTQVLLASTEGMYLD
jgi:cytochrome c553